MSAYDKLILNDENKKCVDKVLFENSISMTSKIVCSLNYIPQKDKRLYLDNIISASQLYECRKSNMVACEELTPEQKLKKRAKQLKDDTEIPLTLEMITEMFENTTCDYIENVLRYENMADQIANNTCNNADAINKIIVSAGMVEKVIASFKEVLINKQY